jgi:peptide/nickel transport system ATP-binding protein
MLLDTIPRVGKKWVEGMTLSNWDGTEQDVPGCKFSGHCKYAQDACCVAEPHMVDIDAEHRVLCIKHNEFQTNQIRR